MSVEVLHYGNTDFYDLDLDPMTFIYELDRIPADQNFAFFVNAFESYRQTYATEAC